MKVILISGLFFLCSQQAFSQPCDTQLIPFRRGERWGYCTPDKKTQIEPQFTDASFFIGPLTSVRIDSYYCVINKKGNIVFKSTHFTQVVNNGTCFIGPSSFYEYRMYDEQGAPVTKTYNAITDFNRYGYATFTEHYVKLGLIDKTYTEVLPAKYESIDFFTRDLLCVYDGASRKHGLYNLKTKKEVPCTFDNIYPLHEGLCMAEKDGRYGFIDADGNTVIPFTYGKATPDNIGAQERYNESTYQGYNYDGFYNGLAVVVDGDRSGYINKLGEVTIPFVYDKAFGFIDGKAWVRKSGKWGMIDTRGRFVLQPLYKAPAYLEAKELLALDGFHEGLIAVARDSLYGYVDTSGKLVIPFQFQQAEPFYDGLAAVYAGNKVAFINRSGKIVISPVFKWVEGTGQADTHPFVHGFGIAMTDDNKWVVIDKKGHKILPQIFDGSDRIGVEQGIATGISQRKTYVFNAGGDILYTSDQAGFISIYTPQLIYSYAEKCYINIKNRIHYCE